MVTESFDTRYDAWGAAEAKVFEAMGLEVSVGKLEALRTRADVLLTVLWSDGDPPSAHNSGRGSGSAT